MPGVFPGEPLSSENMSQVPLAGSANDFSPPSVCIWNAAHRPFNLIVEARPSAPRGEFVSASIQGSVALPAMVRARLVEIVVFACVRCLGSLVQNDTGFFRRQGLHVAIGTVDDDRGLSEPFVCFAVSIFHVLMCHRLARQHPITCYPTPKAAQNARIDWRKPLY